LQPEVARGTGQPGPFGHGIRVPVADVTPLLERHLAAALGYRAWRRIHTVTPLVASGAERATA